MPKMKVDKSKGPDPKSTRSKKRANRDFKSVASSTRKGRRAAKRLAVACSIKGQSFKPGEKTTVPLPGKATPAMHTAGGAFKPH